MYIYVIVIYIYYNNLSLIWGWSKKAETNQNTGHHPSHSLIHCATDFSSGCVPLAVPPLLDICLPLRLLTISCKGELHYSYANGSHYGGTKCKSQKSRDFSVGMLRRAMTSERSNTLNSNQRHVVTQCTCSAVWVYLWSPIYMHIKVAKVNRHTQCCTAVSRTSN